MPPVAFVVPGRLDTRTGGYIYDRCVVDGLQDRGWPVTVVEIDDDFPFPSDGSRARAAAALGALPDQAVVLVDGLAYGALPELVRAHAGRLRFVPIVHLPLAEDVDLDGHTATRLRAGEIAAAGVACAVIATGSSTARTMRDYGVEAARIVVAPPGTDAAPLSRGSGGDGLELLCVATVNPGKGHATLVRALRETPDFRWHLTCAGSLTRHAPTVTALRQQIADAGLDDRITLAGDLPPDDLARCYHRADLFVLATRKETFGMAVAEAVARGLPVVSTATGAIPELVGAGGIIVPVGDERAFVEAVHRMLSDEPFRRRCADAARASRKRLHGWSETLDKIEAVLNGLT
jgi:glycosyltransferase involved in cell wall biosynthesis